MDTKKVKAIIRIAKRVVSRVENSPENRANWQEVARQVANREVAYLRDGWTQEEYELLRQKIFKDLVSKLEP